ncbi:MAG: DUF1697 domain-containing protein [Balneolaceae bacterium]|nr:DUF1697 domain-containing protein [Balneolaceae bacterium]
MKTNIAFLRAINVGGYRKIKMADLRSIFESMGFENVKTYIQSGNVVFDAPVEKEDELSGMITQQIEDSFGHDVPVLIREPETLEKVLKAFPFKEKTGWKGYIGFLAKEPNSIDVNKLESNSSNIEKFRVAGKNLYVYVDKETEEKPNFSNGYIEKELGMHATTRNLRTVRKILDLSRQ